MGRRKADWVRRAKPKLARHLSGLDRKEGKGWNAGQLAKSAKKAAARAESGRPAAREAREQAAERRYGTREPSSTAEARKPARVLKSDSKAVKTRKRVTGSRGG